MSELLKVNTCDWMPRNTIALVNPGIRVEVQHEQTGTVAEYWYKPPQIILLERED